MPYKNPAAQRDYQRRWHAQRRARFFADKACDWCGATEQLELHHRDPNKKVSHKIWSWGDARRMAEIAKCFILCRECHQRAHSEARRLEAELRNPHGTRRRYHLGCHCDDCRRGNREYERERKRRNEERAA